jgi:hypothetical protein
MHKATIAAHELPILSAAHRRIVAPKVSMASDGRPVPNTATVRSVDQVIDTIDRWCLPHRPVKL